MTVAREREGPLPTWPGPLPDGRLSSSSWLGPEEVAEAERFQTHPRVFSARHRRKPATKRWH